MWCVPLEHRRLPVPHAALAEPQQGVVGLAVWCGVATLFRVLCLCTYACERVCPGVLLFKAAGLVWSHQGSCLLAGPAPCHVPCEGCASCHAQCVGCVHQVTGLRLKRHV